MVWEAFRGYGDIYGRLPSARLVRRVRLYLIEKNRFETEEHDKMQDELEQQRRKAGR